MLNLDQFEFSVGVFELIVIMEVEKVLSFVSKLGVGLRHPHSEFYKEGNEHCQFLKPYGFFDFDNENFYHKPYVQFSCHIPGCERTFETVLEYESHYNSCHCYTCKECNKNLPNYHLLDLHISETHDSFFMAQAKKSPMFKCFLEECKESFMNPMKRRDHCINIHKFPSDFRFDSSKKVQPHKKKTSEKKSASQEKMEIADLSDNNSKLETSLNKSKKNQNTNKFRGFSFGRGQSKRKPVFYNFSKDLLDTLP